MGKSNSLLQPWSASASPEAHCCMDSGKDSSFKEVDTNGCQVAQDDYIICGTSEDFRKSTSSPQGCYRLSPCTGIRVGERYFLMSLSESPNTLLHCQPRTGIATTLFHPKTLQGTCPNLTLLVSTPKTLLEGPGKAYRQGIHPQHQLGEQRVAEITRPEEPRKG